MKKLLLNALFAFTTIAGHAQIEDGSVAPDFTVTDVYGVTHKLSDYLAQGKTVIMDISATWCSPCWNYHSSGALTGLYYTLGQGGSGEVVVLLVEGDSQTSVDCLFGISPENLTWGNWVEHSPYPVIDSALIGQLYQIEYFPTIFRICPDGIVNEIDQLDTEELISDIALNCGTSEGIQKNAHPHIDNLLVCQGLPISPQATLTNYGSEALTAATVQLLQGETVLATKNFTGNLSTYEDSTVTFDPLEIAEGEGYTIKVSAINGSTPENVLSTRQQFSVVQAPEAYNNITVKVFTDFYPGEISWAIKNSAGTTIASMAYLPGPDGGEFGGGGPDASTTKIHEIVLPGSAEDCYTVELYDTYGDGWTQGPTHHGFEIWSAGEKIFEKNGEDFDSELIAQPAFKANGLLNTTEQQVAQFTLSPNPAKDIIQLTGIEKADVTLIDMTGKVVFTANDIENGSTLNLSLLQKGIYTAQITSAGTTTTQKVILN